MTSYIAAGIEVCEYNHHDDMDLLLIPQYRGLASNGPHKQDATVFVLMQIRCRLTSKVDDAHPHLIDLYHYRALHPHQIRV